MKDKKSFVFISLLVPLLFVTDTVEQSIIFSVAFALAFTLYVCFMKLAKKIIKKDINEGLELLITAIVVSFLIYLFKLYIPFVYENSTIYYLLLIFIIPILYKKLDIENNKKVVMKNIVYVAILFIFTGLVKEIMGSGTITLMDLSKNITGYIEIIRLPSSLYYPISYFQSPSFSFLLAAALLCIIRSCEK